MLDTKEWTLTSTDRCDERNCGAQAYVLVKGVSGELTFCSHHYEESSGEKLSAFAFEVVDERERLIENRLKGEN